MTSSLFTLVADFDDFVVINKAPDISVHRDRSSHGLLEQVAADLQFDKLYLVHRLDRMTSGLLLLAKSAASCAALAALFAERSVEKYYFALSSHRPLKKQGLVQGDMQRSRDGSWRLARAQTNPAVTRFFSNTIQPGLRLFILRPSTGKTHQLRVAMKSLGAPILGDGRYGGAVADRGYLHAFALRFHYAGRFICVWDWPRQGEWFSNPAVIAALQNAAQPWQLPWPEGKKQTTENRQP
jgi:tRNA pseudouridine32 synthase / 23S rRNA pseudouridine746 synthase